MTPARLQTAPHTSRLPLLSALLLALGALLPQAFAADVAARRFSLPAGPAAQTLREFSGQAGRGVVFVTEVVRDVRTNAVEGELPPATALRQLLAGTALVAEEDAGTGAFAVRRTPAGGEPAPARRPDQAAAGPAGAGRDEIIELSPFQVDASQDTGYAARSTLAGTRFNTALRDVAAPLTVLTPEFLADIGAHTMTEAIAFTVSGERDPAPFDSSSNAPASARIRGIFIRANSQDFFNTNFPLDDYNLEQISVNRGANSLLFGVGSPGGLITGVTKRAHFRPAGSVSLEVGSHDSFRSSLDYNRVLIPERLAVRFSWLHRDTHTSREATEWRDRRLYTAFTWRVSRRAGWQTTLRGNFEVGSADRVTGNLSTPTDAISAWLAAGRPTVDGVRPATTGPVPAGLVNAAGTPNLVVIGGSGSALPILNWQGTVRGSNPTPALGLGPDSPVPLGFNYLGTVRSTDYSGNSHTLFLEQQFGPGLSAELAWFQNHLDNTWVRDPSGGQVLTVDANRLLPNGQPNPNVGRLYTEGTIRPQVQERLARELRLTVAWKLELARRSRWLGDHQLGLLLSRRRDDFAFDDMQEVNTTPLPGYATRLDSPQNLIIRRTYLGAGGGQTWLQGSPRWHEIPLINENGIRSAFLPVQRIRRDKVLVDSTVAGVQSHLLDRRLVLTGGVRRDWNRSYVPDPARAVKDARGVFPSWKQLPFAATPTSDQRGNTYTFGAVAHLFAGWSAFYSRSESQDIADPSPSWFGDALPVPQGFGQDLGLRFQGLGERLTVSLSRFHSGQRNQQNNSLNGTIPRVNEMASTLGRPELAVPSTARDTQDLESRGWELEGVFNPTPAWRIALNASRNSSITTNLVPRTARFLQERLFPLEGRFGPTLLPNGQTFAQEVATLRNSLLNNRDALEGAQTSELREWTGSAVTNYSFPAGPLRNFSVGGYVQYRGHSDLGARINPATGRIDQSLRTQGNDFWLAGLHLGYQRRLAEGRRLSLRLGVANLLDERDLIEKAANAANGRITTYFIQEPRSYTLRAGLAF